MSPDTPGPSSSPPSWPSSDLDPRALVEEWLPKAWADSGLEAPDGAPTLRLTLSGDGGGDWVLGANGDAIEVERLPAVSKGTVSVNVWLRQPAEDFRAVYAGDADLPTLVPRGGSAFDVLGIDPRDADLVRQIDGRVLLELSGKRRRRWSLDMAFGPGGLSAGRPRSTVKIDAVVYEGLLQGRVAPLQALMDKRVSIEGDRALAMQMLMLALSRLKRGG